MGKQVVVERNSYLVRDSLRSKARAQHPPAKEPPAKVPPSKLRVEDFMTVSPHSIAKGQTLSVAHEIMRSQKIRHLPVLESGNLIGLLSQRDLFLIETLSDDDPAQISVEEAMEREVFAVTPEEPLVEVAKFMAKKKFGCAVIMEHKRVIGIFTTVDALRALAVLAK